MKKLPIEILRSLHSRSPSPLPPYRTGLVTLRAMKKSLRPFYGAEIFQGILRGECCLHVLKGRSPARIEIPLFPNREAALLCRNRVPQRPKRCGFQQRFYIAEKTPC